WEDGATTFAVTDKFTGAPIAQVASASRAQTDAAIRAASESFARERLTPYARYEILHRAADLVGARRDAFASAIVAESGFTVSDAENEIARAIQTLLACGEEAKRLAGEVVPIDGAPGQEHRIAFTLRVPVGVVCAITP